MTTISTENLVKHQLLGKGGFGEVYRGLYINTPVAIKTLIDTSSNGAFSKEIQILKRLTHPNIVTIIAYDSFHMILELYDSSLKSIKNKEEMSLVARDCMRAISFMHSHNNMCMRHRDIKPENILINYDKSGKIYKASLGDLGLATSCLSKNHGGTRGFTPFIKNGSDRMHDIFALAVSILDAIFDEPVHGAKDSYDNIHDYPKSGNKPTSENNTMYYARQLLPEYFRVISEMLILVHVPGDNENDKKQIVDSILKDWTILYDSNHMSEKIKKSPISRFLNKLTL